jgi:hypothetical protein
MLQMQKDYTVVNCAVADKPTLTVLVADASTYGCNYVGRGISHDVIVFKDVFFNKLADAELYANLFYGNEYNIVIAPFEG